MRVSKSNTCMRNTVQQLTENCLSLEEL